MQPCDINNKTNELLSQLNNLEHGQQMLSSLEAQLIALENDYQEQAIKLTYSRKKAAKELDKKVTSQLKKLDICGPFSTSIKSLLKEKPSKNGLDKIKLMIKTNPGSDELPLDKVASGGELSRISLAIQSITGKHFSTACLVFDEVDIGISGATAQMVGQLLKQISQHSQIICITHLAQVASQGDHHLYIEKHSSKTKTTTGITHLNKTQKIEEIARILGGATLTNNTIQNAKELLTS